MKKRAPKKKTVARPVAATKKKSPAKAKKPAAKAAPMAAAKAAPYNPAPLKGDGWPPFRYPLQ
jgi:hypothetical protein